LKEQLKDPKFTKVYDAEKKLIDMAVIITIERNKLGISQVELARKANVTLQQLYKIENGVNCK
jgi:predicted transcriptional regulator